MWSNERFSSMSTDHVLDLVERVDRVVELEVDEARGRVGGSS